MEEKGSEWLLKKETEEKKIVESLFYWPPQVAGKQNKGQPTLYKNRRNKRLEAKFLICWNHKEQHEDDREAASLKLFN